MRERLQQLVDWVLDPLGGWAGRRWGFFETIARLEKEAAALEITVEGMHAHYMKEYRNLETSVAALATMALPELRVKMMNLLIERHGAFEFQGTLTMAATEPRHQLRYDGVNCRTVITSDVRLGFAFTDRGISSLESQTKRQEYPLALAFAKKAGEMAYDAVMNDLKFRPTEIFNSKK